RSVTKEPGESVNAYTIGYYVWIASEPNGQQDSGEEPLANVTVNLLDAAGNPVPGQTTTTDANGYYQFDELPAGDYIVEFVLPDGYTFTGQNVDGVPTDKNSDANVETGRTTVVTLGDDNPRLVDSEGVKATEGIDPTWDAGVIPVEPEEPSIKVDK